MTKNPFYNAGTAALYIFAIVNVVMLIEDMTRGRDNYMTPVVVLSLLVLSASVMAYIFFYKPMVMILDGQRTEAAKLFLQTVGIFAGITIAVIVATLAFFS